MKFRTIGSGFALAALAACSSGGGSAIAPVKPPVQTPTGPGSSSVKRVKATIVLPRRRANAAAKKRHYVSPGTLGLVIEADQIVSGGPTPVTSVYSQTGYDLSPNSSDSDVTCMQVSGGTQCTISINAPATSSTSSDAIYIYAYDTAQTSGALATGYTAQGNLLSQDVGTGSGDPVPSSTGSANASGITANADNTLTFVLSPVVETPDASIGAAQAPPLGSTTLVVSAPGSGGTSNGFTVDGYDASAAEIMSFLAGNGTGDDVYVNPIGATIASSTGGTQFSLSTASLTSATSDNVTATYAQTSADTPTSAATAVPYATATFSDRFTGGFGNATSYATVSSTVEVAPLFAYAGSVATGFSGNVYALQAAKPTGATYTLTIDSASNNDCSAYMSANGGSIGAASAGASGTDQQAVFALTAGTDTGSGAGCTLDLSDGFSTITLPIASTGTTATTVIPSKYSQPVYSQSGTSAAGSEFSFAARNAGDTLVCLMSVVSSTFAGVSTTSSYPIHPITQSLAGDTSDGMGTSYAGTSPFSGIEGFAVDASAAGVTLSDGTASGAPAAFWCGEYTLTSAYDIGNASIGAFQLGTAATTPVASPTMNDVVIVAVGGADPTPYTVDSGFKQNASVPASRDVVTSLFVESLPGLTPRTNATAYTVPGGSGASVATGFVFIPITTANGGSPNFGMLRRR